MSHWSAMTKPPPSATPLSAPIVGFVAVEDLVDVAVLRLDLEPPHPAAGEGVLFQVEAGAEGAARAGEHRDADVVVPIDLLADGGDGLEHLPRQGIESLRPVERDGGEVAVLLVQQILIFQGVLPGARRRSYPRG